MSDTCTPDVITDKWIRLMKIGWGLRLRSDTSKKINSYLAGMSYRQIDILVILECLGIHTVSEIAAFLKVSKSTASIVINKLVSKGYVIKERPSDSEDGRRTYLTISDKGVSVLEKMGRVYIEGLAELYSMFDEQTKAAFRQGVSYLRQVNNHGETLIGFIAKNHCNEPEQDEDIKNLSVDIAYFIISSKINGMDDGMVKLPYNITVNQFQLLLCIGESDMDSISKLENYLGSSGSTLSIGVSKLVNKGYLKKEYPKSGEDGRKVYIRITDKGRDVLKSASDAVQNRFKEYLLTLSEDKIQMFNKACDCFLQAFKKIM